MHDGAVATLEEAVEHTSKTPGRRGFSLTPDERADLVACLQSLTDEELLKDPRFADPWPASDRAARGGTLAR
jgi:cytochrome c peroxidase